MINISVVSYINAAPFRYGLENYLDKDIFKLHIDTPDICAQKLITNEIDIGLVPIAIIPKLKEAHIVSSYCIGAIGKVNSVKLYSNVNIEHIKTIVLDKESNTSNQLCQLLCKHYWKINPDFVTENQNNGNETAYVIIGDRALLANGTYLFEYDLSEAWFDCTQQPFVFAAWIANKKLPTAMLSLFNRALEKSLADKELIISTLEKKYAYLPVRDYLTNNIQYQLNQPIELIVDRFLTLSKA